MLRHAFVCGLEDRILRAGDGRGAAISGGVYNPSAPVDYERVVLDNLPLVDAIVSSIARRYRLSADEAKELGAAVRLKLVDRNYEVLRRFKNESSLRTYLITVINRHFLDRRIADWGKWRPSAIARRHGPHAVALDRLVTRDGVAVEQAIEKVAAAFEVSRAELEVVAQQLPYRTQRRFGDETELERLPSGESEREMIAAIDRGSMGEVVDTALSAALAQLGPQDRIILKMRFCDGCTVASIARAMQLDQKGLYRRLVDILRVLRAELERRGVRAEDAVELIGHHEGDLEKALGRTESVTGGPSVR